MTTTHIVLAMLFAFGIGVVATRYIARIFDRYARVKRSRYASYSERAAERTLVASGFRITDKQARRACVVGCNGTDVRFEVIADFLVERNGSIFVAEVKSGNDRSIRNRNTRRQLLEYAMVFEADGVLLVDMVDESILEIDFFFGDRELEAA